jgi:hypothetical protein
MKNAIRMTAVALATMGAMSAFAADRYEPTASAQGPAASRAEVQAAAVAAVKDRHTRVVTTGGDVLNRAPAANLTSQLSRDEVRADAIKARGTQSIDVDRS